MHETRSEPKGSVLAAHERAKNRATPRALSLARAIPHRVVMRAITMQGAASWTSWQHALNIVKRFPLERKERRRTCTDSRSFPRCTSEPSPERRSAARVSLADLAPEAKTCERRRSRVQRSALDSGGGSPSYACPALSGRLPHDERRQPDYGSNDLRCQSSGHDEIQYRAMA